MAAEDWNNPIQGFEWSDAKANSNWKKHRVRFEEAVTIFAGPFVLEYADDLHSTNDETRYLTLGMSVYGRLLLVANCERNGKIRLISARIATPGERATYEAKSH